jgi:putative membrane protein
VTVPPKLSPERSPAPPAAEGPGWAPGWADAAPAEAPPWNPGWDATPVQGGLVRHEAPASLAPLPVGRGAGWLRSLGLVGGAFGLLVLGGGGLWLGVALDELFARSAALGWAGSALGLGVLGLLGAGLGREWRALRKLAALDRLAAELRQTPDAAPPPPALLRWAEGLAERLPEASPAIDQIRAAATLGEARGLAAGLLQPVLAARVSALGGGAARQVFIATAVMPAPALDAAAMALLGLRLMRQVAELHGLRPGALVLARLLRRLAFSTGLAVGTEMAVEAGLEQMVEGHAARLAGGAAGAAVAARRMARLAVATGEACRPF